MRCATPSNGLRATAAGCRTYRSRHLAGPARDDLPILMMLLRETPSSAIAAEVGIGAASIDARRSAILRDLLAEPGLVWSRLDLRAGEPAAAASEAEPRIVIAA